MGRHFLLLASFLLLSIIGYSQTASRTEVYTMGFKVLTLEKTANQTFRATIDHGNDIGIKTGGGATVFGILRPDVESHNHKLGTAEWVQVLPLKAVAQITLYENEVIKEGDLLYANVTVPYRTRTSYFFLITEAITLINDQDQPYYTFKEIVDKDGYPLRTEKFLAMQKDIQASGAKLKQAGDKTIVEEGPHKGELVSEAMMKTDTLEIWYFIHHLNQSSWETMGQTFRLGDVYKTYAKEGDAASSSVLKSFFKGVSDAEKEKKYTQYKRKITKNLLDGWKNEAFEMLKEKNYTDAEELLDICIYLAEKNKSGYDLGVYLFSKGQLYDNQADYNKSMVQYELSIKAFTEAKEEFAAAYTNNSLAAAHFKLGENEKALALYRKSIDSWTRLCKANPESTDNLNNLYLTLDATASVVYKMEDYQGALNYYQEALKVAQQAKNANNEGSAIWNIGYTYGEGLGNNEQALVYYHKAVDKHFALQDTASVVTLKRSIGIVNYNMKNYDKAKQEVASGIALARSWDDAVSLAYILEYQGLLFYELGEYDNSIKSYSEAENIYAKLGDSAKLQSVKKVLAKSLRDSKKYDLGLAKHKERFALIDKNDFIAKADIEWDIAYLYGQKKDHKNEILYYREAEKDYIQAKDSASLSSVRRNLGYSYRDAGDSTNSYKIMEVAIAMDRKRGDIASLAMSQEYLANDYKYFKNFKKAAEQFDASHDSYEKTGNLLKAGKMLDELAYRYIDLKKYPQAEATYKKEIDIFHRLANKKEEGGAYWNYSYFLGQSVDRHEEAISNYRIAYDLFMEARDSVNASVMLSNVGQNYWSLSNYDKAIESHKAAIALATKCKNKQQVASSWTKLATLYKESANPVEATRALNNAVTALLEVNDSSTLATTYYDLATSYSSTKDYTNAVSYYNKAIAIRKAQRDTINWSSALAGLGAVYHVKYDFKNAEKNYLEALALRKKSKDKDAQTYSLVDLGNLEVNVTNNYVKAEKYFLDAERLGKETKNEYIVAYIYGQMRWLYKSTGRSAQADAISKKSLDLYQKNKYWKDVANTLVNMGYDASYVRGNQMQALTLLDQAQAIADTIKDVVLQASIYSARGSTLREIGDFQKALEFSNKSYDLYKQVDNEWGLAGVYIDNGNLYRQLSEYEQAIKNQTKADSLFIKMGADYARLAPLANIGENYAAQGDYKKALEYYNKSLAIVKKANDLNENLAILQALIGEANFYLGNYTEADKWLKESLATCDIVGAMRPKTDNLAIIGRLKIEEKKYDEARKYLTEGLRIAKEKSMRISYLNNLVLLGKLEVEQKKYAAAKPLLEECVKTSRELGKYTTLWESLFWQGTMFKEENQLALSKESLKESVAIIEKIRNKVAGGDEARKLFSSDKNITKVYEVLVDVLLQLGETDEAMSYLQKNNEDNLKAKFRGLDVKFQNESKNKVLTQERDMKAKLDGIEEQLANEKAQPLAKQNAEKIKNLQGIQSIAEGDYLKFVNQQVNVQPELSKYFNNSVQPSEFRKRKKQIPKDMALLSYLPGEKQLYIFMATTDTVVAKVVNITREQISKDVIAVMNVVRTNQGSFSKLDLTNENKERSELVSDMKQTDKMMIPFEELYHYLIAPVSAEIAGKKKLCIIPNGTLSYIPFQLLGKTLKNGKFSLMANQFSIFYANSTDMLLRTLDADTKNYSILAFANPDKSLPSTEKEVADIKKLFPSASVYTRDDATEDKAKFAGENFNVMHFATHGNLDYEDFSKSYLTMAVNPSKHEDGRLTLEELWGMEVMNHLNIVVLSACETAVTKGSNESSPVSPASGFLQNGVKSVVATLWKVDDEATSLLIGDFYKNIKTMDAVDALRTAQVNLSANPKFSLPYYWAGAILMGDWR